MKVLFIEPYIDYINHIPNTGVHLGILSIISFVRSYRSDIDCRFFSEQINIFIGKEERSEEIVKKWSPDVVCISSITSQFPRAVKIADLSKKNGAFVILGNIFPSLNAVTILNEYEVFDLIVIGDGEETIAEILIHLEDDYSWKNINGIAFRFEDKVKVNDLRQPLHFSSLPAPAFDIIPKKLFSSLSLPATIETSRGCPFNCNFCSLHEFTLGKYRVKSTHQVVRELFVLNELGIKKIIVTDDTFTADRKRVVELCNEIERNKFDFHFIVLTRIDLLDAEMVKYLSKAGVKEVLFGVEHIDSDALSSMRKTKETRNWSEIVLRNMFLLENSGIISHPIYLLGWPGDTKDKMKRLEAFAIENGQSELVEPFISFTTPHPGTKLWENRDELGIKVITSDLSKFLHLYPVAIPESLGESGLLEMIDTHNRIRLETSMEMRNPLLNHEFVKDYSDLI